MTLATPHTESSSQSEQTQRLTQNKEVKRSSREAAAERKNHVQEIIDTYLLESEEKWFSEVTGHSTL